jgi:chitin-binding protein
MSGKLPADRSGRHLLYIVWQTTSTPDTYYSCSDLVIKPAAATGKAVVAPARTTPAARRSSAAVTRSPAAAPATSAAAPGTVAAPALSPVSSQTNWKADLGREILAGALLVIVAVAAGMALVRIRRRRGATR